MLSYDDRAGTRSSRLRLAVGGMLILALLLPTTSAVQAKDAKSAISVVARVPESDESEASTTYILDIDSRRQRMLYLWRRGPQFYLRDYDIRSDTPRLLREQHIGNYDTFALDAASPYTISVDRKRKLAYFLVPSYAGSAIRVVDLDTFKVLGTWDFTSAVPGFLPEGMTFSPDDDRIYIVGGFYGGGHAQLALSITKPAIGTGVIAIDPPKTPEDEPTVAWVRPVAECQAPLTTRGTGALIARSMFRPALYFGCVRSDPYPGQSGLIRLGIEPDADRGAAAQFALDLFPISGSYTGRFGAIQGSGAFDQKTDRFFMQSQSLGSPGTWVFDGRLSSWVGFIAAPDDNNHFLGLDQASGRFYMASSDSTGDKDSYLLVTDGRATPIPQGIVYRGLGTAGFIATDPPTRRLYVKMELGKLGLGKTGERGFAVLRDATPSPQRPKPIDFDALTSDIAEGPKTITSYSAGVSGFGTRAVLVGGYGGITSAGGTPIGIGQLRPGDRGVTVARLTSVDMRDVGASAAAQAFVADSNTEAEVSDSGAGELPWRPVSCLDGNGESISEEDSQHAGRASVQCDLKKQIVSASSKFGELRSGSVSVAHSSINATARRDPKLGTVTQVEAVASGIELPSPHGSIVIGQVATTVQTVAHGRPGTAEAEWKRVISGVEVRDADGEVVQRLGGCDSNEKEDLCAELEKEINSLLPMRVRLDLPRPDLQQTPKGALAGVQQNDGDFYGNRTVNNQGAVFDGEGGTRAVPAAQITVFNDTQEKSRLVIQLAAVQASSIYTISQNDPFEEGPVNLPDVDDLPVPDVDTGSVGDVGIGDIEFEETAGLDDVVAAEDQPIDASEQVLVAAEVEGVLAFLQRSPQEAGLVAMVWLLFGGAGWTLFRRRQLLNVLGGSR